MDMEDEDSSDAEEFPAGEGAEEEKPAEDDGEISAADGSASVASEESDKSCEEEEEDDRADDKREDAEGKTGKKASSSASVKRKLDEDFSKADKDPESGEAEAVEITSMKMSSPTKRKLQLLRIMNQINSLRCLG